MICICDHMEKHILQGKSEGHIAFKGKLTWGGRKHSHNWPQLAQVTSCVPPTTPSSHQKAVAFDPVINFWALKAPPRAKNGHFGAPNGQNQAICGGMATHKACFGWIGRLGFARLVDKITPTMLTTCLVATCRFWKLRGPGF